MYSLNIIFSIKKYQELCLLINQLLLLIISNSIID